MIKLKNEAKKYWKIRPRLSNDSTRNKRTEIKEPSNTRIWHVFLPKNQQANQMYPNTKAKYPRATFQLSNLDKPHENID